MNKNFKTTIGGQALIEGVMMRGPEKTAFAVRQPDHEIFVETSENSAKKWYSKIPFVRGFFSLIISMIAGYKYLMRSAEIAGTEEENEAPGEFEQWLSKTFKVDIMTVVAVVALILAMGLSVLLFIVVPTGLGSLVKTLTTNRVIVSLVEGVLKIAIFIGYIALVARVPDIKRVFQYHGAEHKTLACYEAGQELTVENIRPMTRLHPRCGTSFMLITLIVSIVVIAIVPVYNTWLKMVFKILLLPVVAGISYEIIMYAGRKDSAFTRAISKPGMWLQKITTNEPDDSQIEVAIAAMNPVLPSQDGLDNW